LFSISSVFALVDENDEVLATADSPLPRIERLKLVQTADRQISSCWRIVELEGGAKNAPSGSVVGLRGGDNVAATERSM
jgi:hypothetical protein